MENKEEIAQKVDDFAELTCQAEAIKAQLDEKKALLMRVSGKDPLMKQSQKSKHHSLLMKQSKLL